ncbi:hypothetical protein COL5a_007846 [Colletotrichum fioriniae]|nr:hypothetical protein COL5a_007846 [Colletotrichum fioriniae]
MPLGAVNLPASLDDVRVKKLPPSSYYIADFISEEEERLILQKEPRSLLITTDDLYTDYLHGIADIEEDVELSAETIVNWDLLRSQNDFSAGRSARATRTSLTYRDVMQVSKLGAKFGLFGKK